MLVPISIPCRCSKVVIFYFFNHYQVGPTVLLYSYRLVAHFCLVHQVFVFRLLFNESTQRLFFFFLIIIKQDPLVLYIELYQEQKSATPRKGIVTELIFFFFCLLCRGVNKVFHVIIILLVENFESSRGHLLVCVCLCLFDKSFLNFSQMFFANNLIFGFLIWK